MKICVLAKQVPDTESSVNINESGTGVLYDGLKMIMNPYDEYAVEEAVKISATHPGSTTEVVTVGNAGSEEILRTALAMGIESAVRIEDPEEGTCFYKTAFILAKYLKDKQFDLILLGNHAFDDSAGAVGGMLAELLGIPFVSGIVTLEILDGGNLKVTREKEKGADIVSVAMPCVLSCQKGLNIPRYPKLMGLMKAKKKTIPLFTLEDIGFSLQDSGGNGNLKVLRMERPPQRQKGKLLEGEPSQVVSLLMEELRTAKII